MDNETFEQIALGKDFIDASQFLKEGGEVFNENMDARN